MVLVRAIVDGALGATVVRLAVTDVSGRLMLMAVDGATTVLVLLSVATVVVWEEHVSKLFY
jgi:hypothetical protein